MEGSTYYLLPSGVLSCSLFDCEDGGYEMSAEFRTRQRYMPENGNFHNHSCVRVKSFIGMNASRSWQYGNTFSAVKYQLIPVILKPHKSVTEIQ
jgi:hypothetical protein